MVIISPCSKAETIEDGRIWVTYALEHRLSPKWKLSMQIQPYWRDEGDSYDQVTYRPGLYYQFSDRALVGVGYAYASGYPDHRANTHENRVWEDIGYQWGADRLWQFNTRTRLEHRQFEHHGTILHSVRQLIKLSVPLSLSYTLLLSDEYYANFNRTVQGDAGFDQNRLSLGIAARLTPETSLEFDYVNQYAARKSVDIDNHILAITLSQSF
jgi:hypothetical protein